MKVICEGKALRTAAVRRTFVFAESLLPVLLALIDLCNDRLKLLDRIAQPLCLYEQALDIALLEGLTALLNQTADRTLLNEHSDAALLEQIAVRDKQIDAFVHGGNADVILIGDLRRRNDLLALLEIPGKNVILDALCDPDIDRQAVHEVFHNTLLYLRLNSYGVSCYYYNIDIMKSQEAGRNLQRKHRSAAVGQTEIYLCGDPSINQSFDTFPDRSSTRKRMRS